MVAYPHKWNEVLDDCWLRELCANFGKGFCSLLPDNRLLNCGQGLQRPKQNICKGWTSHIRYKVSQLLSHSQKHLVLVIVAVCQEGYQLSAGALFSKGKRDRAQAPD